MNDPDYMGKLVEDFNALDTGDDMGQLVEGMGAMNTGDTRAAAREEEERARAAAAAAAAREEEERARAAAAARLKERQMNTINSHLMGYPELKKLTAHEVYNNSRITKNGSWSEFTSTLGEFLRNQVRANETRGPALRTTSFKTSHKSAKPSAKLSTSIDPPGMGVGGNKSRRNIRRRRKSKKQKRVRHTRRKKTRRHRHSRRR